MVGPLLHRTLSRRLVGIHRAAHHVGASHACLRRAPAREGYRRAQAPVFRLHWTHECLLPRATQALIRKRARVSQVDHPPYARGKPAAGVDALARVHRRLRSALADRDGARALFGVPDVPCIRVLQRAPLAASRRQLCRARVVRERRSGSPSPSAIDPAATRAGRRPSSVSPDGVRDRS